MPVTDPRVDAYIARSRPFAQDVLTSLRAQVHACCPKAVETLKWGFPHFVYEGEILCSMAAFQRHCAFGFWKAALLHEQGFAASDEAMGQLGRITSRADLPTRTELRRWLRAAMKLNAPATRVRRPNRERAPRPRIAVPADLRARLAKRAAARATWARLAPGQRREYLEWITEARRPATRARRLDTTIEWLAEGRTRNWKYAARPA